MIFKEYVTLLLLGHVIGDFYLQTDLLAQQKDKSIAGVTIHALLYAMGMLVVVLPFMSIPLTIAWMIASMFHAAIDFLKFSLQKMLYGKNRIPAGASRFFFLADQALHIASILLIALLFATKQISIKELSVFAVLFKALGLPGLSIAGWLLVFLLIHKPANLTVQAVAGNYKASSARNTERDLNAGQTIGTMERLIIIILTILHQYIVIGLLIVAKSIARFFRIAKEKSFAEYYIIGTLTSTIIAIVAYQLIP